MCFNRSELFGKIKLVTAEAKKNLYNIFVSQTFSVAIAHFGIKKILFECNFTKRFKRIRSKILNAI